MFLISFYVPETHAEQVKNALFAEGAGRIGEYECCAWQTLGLGQYRPLAGSNPFQGQINEVSHALEYKIEMVCKPECLKPAIKALLRAHPYETPAYSILKLEQDL